MKVTGLWIGIICIAFGILVLALPKILGWLVGIFLITIGILAIVRR